MAGWPFLTFVFDLFCLVHFRRVQQLNHLSISKGVLQISEFMCHITNLKERVVGRFGIRFSILGNVMWTKTRFPIQQILKKNIKFFCLGIPNRWLEVILF